MEIVAVTLLDETVAAPLMHGALRDTEARGYLRSCEHAPITQSVVTARQVVGAADESDLLEIEGLGFPCAQLPLVQDIGDLTITVAIEKAVDDIIAANPDKVEQAKAKPSMLGWFVGQVMKSSGGKANPAQVNDMLKQKLGIAPGG